MKSNKDMVVIETIVKVVEKALRDNYHIIHPLLSQIKTVKETSQIVRKKQIKIGKTVPSVVKIKQIKSFDPNGWDWLINSTRKNSNKADFVPKGYKILSYLSTWKERLSSKEYERLNKSLCNVVNRSIRKYNKTGDTNDVRTFRRYAELLSRGCLYLMAPSKYDIDNRPSFSIDNCIQVGTFLEKGKYINKNHGDWK